MEGWSYQQSSSSSMYESCGAIVMCGYRCQDAKLGNVLGTENKVEGAKRLVENDAGRECRGGWVLSFAVEEARKSRNRREKNKMVFRINACRNYKEDISIL